MSQIELFIIDVKPLNIVGAHYIHNYLNDKECADLVQEIDRQEWLPDLKRRVQHYGYKYDYTTKKLGKKLGPMPEFLDKLCYRLYENNSIFWEKPDQIIINEYLPGQGIFSHIDSPFCFDDTIATLSLGCAYEMEFHGEQMEDFETTEDCQRITLGIGSLLVLKDEARYEWRHGIQARKSDNGVARQRRISITFRNIKY